MVMIKTLVRPNKRSGFALLPGKTTKFRGLTITNTSSSTKYIDSKKQK